MIEEMDKSYVITAFANGLESHQVWRKHVLRNTLIPVLSFIGIQFGHLLSGAFVVETIFAWPGLGRLTVQAIFDQDFPVVLGAVIISSFIFQFLNLLVDGLHKLLDPRICGGSS